MPNSSSHTVLKVATGTLVIVPLGYLGYLYTPGMLNGLGSQSLIVILVAYLVLIAFYFGGYTVVRWLFGVSMARCAFGFSCGAMAIACLVLAPYGAMVAANLGWYEPPVNSGSRNSGTAFGILLLATPAFLIYLALAIGGWRARWRTPDAGGNLELANPTRERYEPN